MKEIQKKIKSFLENRPVIKNNDSPEKLVYKLKGEVQELFDEVKWGDREPTTKEIKKVEMELADVIIYSVQIGTLLGIDIKSAIKEKININKKRFPKKLFQEGNFYEIYTNRKIDLGERPNIIQSKLDI